MTAHPYTKQNYELKRYAFVSDYVRLKALNDFGGLYLDTDVEIKKKFDDSFLDYGMFLPFMYDCTLSTAVIGAEPGHEAIKKLLDQYRDLEIKDSPNNGLFTRFFLQEFENFRLNNRFQVLNGTIAVFPKEYFECPTFSRDMGYSVHHFTGSWKVKDDRKFRNIIKWLAKSVIGDVLYSKMQRYRALRISPFYDTYLEHKHGVS
ncbi:Glycosyltransferase sugar-binding region containing DXD motif-containing protein [Alicyclobacillus macrosporangiidus]|uniref:Glycosyltransferase sugar-binding region containing DXD motif-containing protein n=1 Tax=Alicyclobacillus macrosporangiidus TaxID=392015 RepID=A0A1I7LC74_9BACL|nr:glycosyltransferase [Alicyclobacillus macrosporangiidus]SFV07311.1 Glycosyltransferase sugar-binding region containing DXD motif-containing protein [Alicyclobacillus macrosporangiidus]